jgi:hypothetical protein
MMIVANSTCVDQVPVLSANVPAVSTSGDFSSQYLGWNAFDSSLTSMWISQTYVSPAWIAYQFTSAKTITSYSINYVNGQITTRAPKVFQLQASNDGSTWVAVDIRTNEINWSGNELRTYVVSSPGSYSRYRLHVTDDNDDRTGVVVVSMGDLTLTACTGCDFLAEQVPVLTGNSAAVTASGVYDSTYPAWQVFDNNYQTMWISAVGQTPAWIAYQFSSPRLIEQYSLLYSNGKIRTRAPKDWKLEGWNGVNWITIDSRSNQINWLGTETRHYNVANPGSYIKYRLLVSDDNDSRVGVVVISLGGLSFRGCP